MGAPVTVFFDTSFISEAPLESVKFFLDQSDAAFITDRVLEELQAGYDSYPSDKRFTSIFKIISDYRMTNNLRIISLNRCTKDNSQPTFTSDTVFFRRNSLLCSGYYAWLPYAMNPSILTDPYRHMYNSGLYSIRTKGDPGNKMADCLGYLRTNEINHLEQIGFKENKFTVSALRKARKKRLKDTKRNNTKITDYSLVVAAFLYFCFYRRNVILLTCDYDLHDIKDNLIRSALEKYTLNKLLTDKIATAWRRETLNDNIRLSLGRQEILDELINNTFKRLDDTAAPKGLFHVAFYDKRDSKIYGGVARLPVWLLDFVLEYRLNFNCYSTHEKLDEKYPFNYVMNPSEDFEEIEFNITERKKRLFYRLMPNCEDICSPARIERDDPSGITSFVEKSDFDSRSERDFSNPWLNAGFSFFLLGNYDHAVTAFNNAIDLQHDRADGWYGKGISLSKLDRHEEALAALDKATKLRPDHYEAFFCWGGVLLELSVIREGSVREALLGESAQKFSRAIEIKPDQPEVLHNWGNALMHLALMREGTDRLTLLREAAQKYAMAAGFSSEMAETVYGWGAALANLAALSEGHDRVALFKEAAEKCAMAVKIKPDMPEALYTWGNALLDLAVLREGPDGEEDLLKLAIEKFAKAVEVKPEFHEAVHNWGSALANLANLRQGSDREALLQQAIEKFAMSWKIKPDEPETLYSWGGTLENLADLREGLHREALLREAAEKYAETVKIKSDMKPALARWGIVLGELANLHTGVDREALLKEAIEKYALAAAIDPDDCLVLNDWAYALVNLADLAEESDREALLKEAIEKCIRASEIKPDDHEALQRWAYALMYLADLREVPDREALLRAAVEKCAMAVKIKPGDYSVLNNWAFSLVNLADLVEDDREALLNEAVEKCAIATESNPRDYAAFYNWGNALRKLAYIYRGKQRIETLHAALEKAKRAEALQSGSGIYSIACAYVLLGDEINALASLKEAITSDPQCKQAASANEEFRSLWEVEEFKKIIAT